MPNNAVKESGTPLKISRKPIYRVFKRLFDIVVSLTMSLLLLPVMLIVTLLTAIKARGNPFYVQQRLGRNGKKFRVYKFRSMKMNADKEMERFLTPEELEQYRREYKLEDDPRLLGYKKKGDGKRCYGAVIRKTSIDELPQLLINVLLLGNMSLVGPRPILDEELKQNYTPEQQALFLSVKPGLTGYWQAYARNNACYADGKRQEMELHYCVHRSFFFDIRIMLRTVLAVVMKTGAK